MLERLENDPEIQEIWAKVNSIAPEDSDAMEIFYEFCVEFGFEKCHCEKPEIRRKKGDRMSVCVGCARCYWFTSGTLLNRVKRFKAYLAAFLIREAGLLISAAAFARLTGIHVGTSSNIQRKISMAMANRMGQEGENIGAVTATPFKDIIARRSRETPARMHPFSEEEEIERLNCDLESDCSTSASTLASISTKTEPAAVPETTPTETDDPFEKAINTVHDHLCDLGISVEKLSSQSSLSIGLVNGALTMLELRGQAKQLSDGTFAKLTLATAPVPLNDVDAAHAVRINVAVNTAQGIIGKVFHRVSRKALQIYLAAIWGVIDRVRWGQYSIFQLCFEHPPVTYMQLLNYVSPPQLKIIL